MTQVLPTKPAGDSASPHDPHPLTRDLVGEGFWGVVDRYAETAAGYLNPILIKEGRQALKSRQFLYTFFLMLLASWLWSVAGVAMRAPDIFYNPSGDFMLAGYYLILAIPLIGIVPLAAHRSLASEIDDGTFEMLAITRLDSMRIVMGKLNSAMLQMAVYFAAIVPCLVFSYLLRGVSSLTIVTLIAVVLFFSGFITTACLFLATLATHRATQMLVLLAAIGLAVGAEFLCGSFVFEVILREELLSDSRGVFACASIAIIGTSFMLLFIKASAARIAPVSENRSTTLRWILYCQQLLWIGVMSAASLFGESTTTVDNNVIKFGIFWLGAYWLLMGSLTLAESPELSPRVQRGLPQTFLGRGLLTWFNPGPGTGYIFAVTSGSAGVITLTIFGEMFAAGFGSRGGSPFAAGIVTIGYLMTFLGLCRLCMELLSKKVPRSFPLSISLLVIWLIAAIVGPMVFNLVMYQGRSMSYGLLQLFNWAWTMDELMRDNAYDFGYATIIFLAGLAFLVLNCLTLLREFSFRKVAAPARVSLDDAARRPAEPDADADPLR